MPGRSPGGITRRGIRGWDHREVRLCAHDPDGHGRKVSPRREKSYLAAKALMVSSVGPALLQALLGWATKSDAVSSGG